MPHFQTREEDIPLIKRGNSGEHENLAYKMMQLELELMGFNKDMVIELLDNEDYIEDTNHAVELLIMGPNGYLHKFAKNPFTLLCKICSGYPMDHEEVRTRE